MHYLMLFVAALPLIAGPAFEQNVGQVEGKAQYFVSSARAAVVFSASGVEFVGGGEKLRLEFAQGARLEWRGEDAEKTAYTYVTGKQVRHAERFGRVKAAGVYPGVDVVFYFKEGKLEYDFVVAPLADAGRIELRFVGEKTRREGEAFVARLGAEEWKQRAPYVYQGGGAIGAGWRETERGTYQLKTMAYNTQQTLVVDPVIEFASLIAGDGDDEVTVVGDNFVAGHTQSRLIDGIGGKKRMGRDIFVRTIAGGVAVGSFRERVVIFGGSGDDTVAGVSVSPLISSILITMAGTTSSEDLPFEGGASKYRGGAADGFVVNITLSRILVGVGERITGQYLGGTGEDRVLGVVVGGSGIYLAGQTDSNDLPVVQAVQSSKGGGKDAFYAVLPGETVEPQVLSYFGGEGDDEAVMLRVVGTGVFALAGTTASRTVVGLEGELRGESDGYLAQVNVAGKVMWGKRLGGSGRDRVTVMLGGTTYFLGGETNSSELGQLAGGVDVFFAELGGNGETRSTTVWGGSGDERLTQMFGTGNGGKLLFGSTTSTDLKVMRALQETNRGGVDGFIVQLDARNEPHVVTYYGGAGDDVLAGAHVRSNGPLVIGGWTTSTDLPEVNPLPVTERGGRDGWVAEISYEVFQVPALIYTTREANGFIAARTTQLFGTGMIRARVKDPAKALLWLAGTTAAEIEAPRGVSIAVVPQADAGETEVELVGDGFATATVRVKIGQLVMTLQPPPTEIHTFVASFVLTSALRVLDPDTGELLVPVNVGLDASALTGTPLVWRSTNTGVLDFPSQATANPTQFTPTIAVRGAGSARLYAEGPVRFYPEGGLEIVVVKGNLVSGKAVATPVVPATVSVGTVPVENLSLPGRTAYQMTGTFRIESENPELLRVLNPEVTISAPGQGGVTFGVRALASTGTARVRVSSSVLERDAFVEVQLVPARLTVGARDLSTGLIRTDFTVRPGAGLQLELLARVGDGFSYLTPELTGASFRSTNAAALTVTQQSGTNVQATAVADGTAELTVVTENPHVTVEKAARVLVATALPVVLTENRIFVGNRLVRSFALPNQVVVRQGVSYRATVEDASIVGLRVAGTTQTGASVQVDPSRQQLLMVGLARAGSTQMRIEVEGYEPLRYTVVATPAGLAFEEERLNLETFAPTSSMRYGAYALDPVALIPIERQGIDGVGDLAVEFAVAGLPIRVTVGRCALASDCLFQITAGSTPGEAIVSVPMVEGFEVPALRAKLVVRVSRGTVALNTHAVKDCFVNARVQALGTAFGVTPFEVTVTSLDPALFLLAPNASPELSTTIRVPWNTVFQVHGVGRGQVGKIRVEAEGIRPFEALVAALDSTVGFYSVVGQANRMLTLNPGDQANFRAQLFAVNNAQVDGVSARVGRLTADISSSVAGVARVDLPEGNVFQGTTPTLAVNLTAISQGTTVLRGSVGGAPGLGLNVTVRPVQFLPLNLLLPPSSVTVRLRLSQANAALGAATYRVAVRDGAKALLREPGQTSGPGRAVIEVKMEDAAAGELRFRVEPLVVEGETAIEVTAPGLETYVLPVYFTTYELRLNSDGAVRQLASGQRAEVSISRVVVPRDDVRVTPPLVVLPTDEVAGEMPLVGFDVEGQGVVAVVEPAPRIPIQNFTSTLRVEGRADGTAKFVLRTPALYRQPAQEAARVVTFAVTAQKLAVSCQRELFYEAITPCSVSNVPAGTVITVRPGNANRLLVSETETEAGAAVRSLPGRGTGAIGFVLHSLARTGESEVVVSAPGYESVTLRLNHYASGFVLRSFGGFLEDRVQVDVGGTRRVDVQFVGLLPDGRAFQLGAAAYRPNAYPATVQVRVANPGVATVNVSSVTVNPGVRQDPSFEVRAVAAGTTTLQVVTPTGFAPIPGADFTLVVR